MSSRTSARFTAPEASGGNTCGIGTAREILDHIYDCWSRGDLRTPAPLFDEHIEYVVRPGLPDPGNWHGRDEFADYTRYFLASWSDLRMRAVSFEPVDDRMLVRVHQTGRGRRSGVQTDLYYFHVWTLRDGVPVKLEVIREEGEARQVAGLPARA